MSAQQHQYVTRHIEAVAGEGGKPVLVLDGRAYPPKAATCDLRRADRHAAAARAQALEAANEKTEALKEWGRASAPSETAAFQTVTSQSSSSIKSSLICCTVALLPSWSSERR